MNNLKDAYIKEKLEKDQLISKKADDVFNNFINNSTKVEKQNRKFNYKKLVAMAASLVIVFGAANVYASTQGYGNVFFFIKYLATGEKVTIEDKEEILSDRDIAISYEPIQITENIAIQIANLQVKDGEDSKLIINVNEKKLDTDAVPLKYKIYDSSKNILCEQDSIKAQKGEEKNVTYTEELKLTNYHKKENILKLEIYKATSDLITTITIDLKTKSITVLGEEEALKKISEIELKDFLGDVAGYTNKDEGFSEIEQKICLATSLLSKADKLQMVDIESEINQGIRVDDINNALGSFCGDKIEEFKETEYYKIVEQNGSKYFVVKTGFDLSLSGNCIDVTNISYCGGLYTVTYTYCYLGEASIFEIDINDFDIYQNTVTIKLNDNDKYSKFQIVSVDEPIIIKSSENKEVGKVEETTENNNSSENENGDSITSSSNENTNKDNNSNNNEPKVDNYASTMSWTEYWAPGIKFKYPTIFKLEEIGGNERGCRQGEISTTITGVATGINPDTKEIVESNLKIDIYEQEYCEYESEEAYFVAETQQPEDLKEVAPAFTTSTGIKWYEHTKTIEGQTIVTYTHYEGDWGNKIVFTTDNYDNYKVINIINWLLGSTKLTSY